MLKAIINIFRRWEWFRKTIKVQRFLKNKKGDILWVEEVF
jgi:hypothetical protein